MQLHPLLVQLAREDDLLVEEESQLALHGLVDEGSRPLDVHLVHGHCAKCWSVTGQDDLHEVVVVKLAELGVVEVLHELLALLLEQLVIATLPQVPQNIVSTDNTVLVNVDSAKGLERF